ncbi:hypothetical protein M408DRAFT_65457 [Serendipita vermifera MAFF 305830]|uniref:Palmitoyltransferase n=1 Tax=Serendipita vermifera MAFF 305830 TaxID=933852 RepID=A0A0C2XPS7_SERVB|nr:hypothetical protein M408DRAFT_65457 [Serendipita vermifera MAFF 305830]
MDGDPLSLPSSTRATIVNITGSEKESTTRINIPSGQPKTSSSSPSSPQSPSGTQSGGGVQQQQQHTFYKPRATSIASARRSRTESLTNSINNNPGSPPQAPPSLSRPASFSRSRPPSASYTAAAAATSVPHSPSLTHTGGILPPASFFHPKQPPSSPYDARPPPLNANNVYAPPRTRTHSASGTATTTTAFVRNGPGGRPSSGISSASSAGGGQLMNMGVPLVSSTSVHAREHGLIMLPLTHIHSRHSDGSTSGPDLSSYSDSSQRRRSSGGHQTTRVKPSREALLPIGEKETLSGSYNSAKSSALTGVRGSLEKIFRRATTSSERERTEVLPVSKDTKQETGNNNGTRTVMDDHARAASSLSNQLRRQNSVNETVAVKSEQPQVMTDLKESPMPRVSEAHTHQHHLAATNQPAHTFEGVSLDNSGFSYGPERNWQVMPSRNKFFFNGHLLTGGDSPLAFIFSISLVLAIGGTWFGTTAVWWWRYESPAVAAVGVYMCLLTIASMLHTAMRDPGILPRNLDIDPPYPSTPPTDGGPRVPLPRDLRVRAGAVRVKYCTTCKIYRPPRSSHCKLCDNCVEGCDHHCPWVNNCIGRRNYTSFFTFLFFANSTLLLVIITSALHLWLLINRAFAPDFASAIKDAPGSTAAFVMSVLVLGPVAALFFYHVRLMLLNVTTIEQVRNQAHRSLMPGPLPPNPFTLNTWYRNLGYLMCRPIIPSYIDAPSLVKHDHRLPNPGHERSARITSDGFESEAYDHLQHQDSSMWKGEADINGLEMEHVGTGNISRRDADVDSSGMVIRSTWDGD